MDLETGVVLIDTVPASCQPHPRLTISSGLRQAPSIWALPGAGEPAFISYDASAVIPKADWRPATDAELRILRSPGPVSPGSSITVFRMPEDILDGLAQARGTLSS